MMRSVIGMAVRPGAGGTKPWMAHRRRAVEAGRGRAVDRRSTRRRKAGVAMKRLGVVVRCRACGLRHRLRGADHVSRRLRLHTLLSLRHGLKLDARLPCLRQRTHHAHLARRSSRLCRQGSWRRCDSAVYTRHVGRLQARRPAGHRPIFPVCVSIERIEVVSAVPEPRPDAATQVDTCVEVAKEVVAEANANEKVTTHSAKADNKRRLIVPTGGDSMAARSTPARTAGRDNPGRSPNIR